MEWYQGGIAEAVVLSRKNGSIFVVYIEGSNDDSKQVTETINTSEVSKMLSGVNFVAIRVEADSVTHQQFSQIYKHSTAPSIYFIGKSGVPLEIITEVLSPRQMIEKINEIVVKNGGSPIEAEGDDPVKGKVQQKEEVPNTCEPEEGAASSAADTEPSIEEKLRLAQELIAKKRKEKEQEENEKERMQELERRKMGQDVQTMKRWQQQQELKQLMDDRQKAKREDQEARNRVKRQIEEDKRDKAARMINMVPPQNQAPEVPKVSVRAVNSDTARLQFRMTNGTSITQDFKSSACLQEVIDYLQTNHNQHQFMLCTTFPKREFTINDASQTLLDLQLVPNSVVLVLPIARGTVATNNSSSGMMGMLWYLLSPILGLFDYLKSFVAGAPKLPATTTETNKRSNTDPEPSASGTVKRRIVGETKIKKQGNVHRLKDHDSDDDNNTWNGNSTQQM